MASVFGHAVLAGAAGAALPKIVRSKLVIALGILCAIMPDADVLSFRFGIPYEALWGHRGMTHSLIFGLAFGALLALVVHYRRSGKDRLILASYYAFCTISHGILDGLTTGGRGVAYFAPWDIDRYFLPWRMIKVSPLGVSNFFSKWGMQVISSEAFWIGIPSVAFIVLCWGLRKLNQSSIA